MALNRMSWPHRMSWPRRMPWPRRGGEPGDAGHFRPVDIVDVDVCAEIAPLHREGPARLLVRQAGRPVAFVPVVVPSGGWSSERVTRAVAGATGLTIARAAPTVGSAPGSPSPDPGAAARVRPPTSVVVTTCEAGPALLGTLDGIRRQTAAPAEVIVVDNRPATSGVAALLAAQQLTGVRLVQEHRPGVSHARNAGLAAATGEIVAFLDDDVVVDEGWLARLVDAFTDEDVACVTGLVLPWELRTVAQCWIEEFGGFGKGFVRRRYDLGANRAPGRLYPYAVGLFGTGANNAFRTGTLRELGGFDEHLGPPHPSRGGEDLDAYLNVLRAGGSIVYEPGALVRHRHHDDIAALRRQIFGYGVGLSAMLTKRLVTSRTERREMVGRAVPALRYLLGRGSAKNARKSRSYPWELTVLEMLGVAYGPVAYWRSRWAG